LASTASTLWCDARRSKLSYEIRLLRSADAEERFRKAYAGRDVQKIDGEDGMSWLTISATTDKVQLAGHRLTLAAKQLRNQGDERTLDQLRSDLAIDLLTGRERDVPLPTYARPIVNLTVPIQTVMGLDDDPGVLSGGQVVPAGLARMIAQHPDATWHRMLTDQAGEMVELSTTSYQPTKAIWTQVVAEHATCFRSGCDTPSTEAELDHRIAWPRGRTTTANLWPGCKRDHKAKHAPGFAIEHGENGSYVLKTAAGFRHTVGGTQHPVNNARRVPEVEDPGFQFSATELLDAIGYLRDLDLTNRSEHYEIDWEEGLDDRIWDLHNVAS
jgi:hypothetical protein